MKRNEARGLSAAVLSLPETAITRSGHAYFPRSNVWQIVALNNTINYKFDDLHSIFSEEIILSLKQVMSWYLYEHSSSHAYNIFSRFRYFARFLAEKHLNISEITSSHVLSCRSQLLPGREWYMGVLSGFFKQWHDMGYPGIHKDIPRLFDEIKIKGNAKGNAVRTMDPEVGPFDDMELQAIHGALNNVFSQGDISVDDFVLVNLYSAIGVRSVQISALKCKDLLVGRNDSGAPTYILNIPSAKKRSEPIRTSFKPRPLIREVGEVLEAWVNQVKISNPVKTLSPEDLPIFPNWGTTMVPGFEHHSSSNNISLRVKKIFKPLKVISHRTGESLKVTPRRFRYTLGTRAAQEGHGELVIAELLDHSDTQQVGVYVEATPAIAERIDKATALELAPIAQAFCGMIVDDEEKAERGNDLTSRVGNPSVGNVGTCGKFGFCGGLAPIACYTCRNFQPWLDAPHEKLLDSLIDERERLLETTGDERIASTNDRTIMAVADVVTQCQSISEERGSIDG